MSIVSNPFVAPAWSVTDSENLQAFLLSETGKRLIHRLRSERPDPSGKTIEEAALSGKLVEGYEMAIRNLFEGITRQVDSSEDSASFPALDRDSAWTPDLQLDNFQVSFHPKNEPPNEAEAELAAKPPSNRP